MICRRCGEDFDGVICTNCGLPYTATPEAPASPMPPVPPVRSEQSQPYAASPAPFSPVPPVPPAVPEQPVSPMPPVPPVNAGPYVPPTSPFSPMPPVPPYPAPAEKNGMATVSMVLGIVALVLASTVLLPLVLGTLAIAFGTVSLNKKTGKGKAIAGIVCSTIAIAITSLLILSSVGSLSPFAEDFEDFEEDFSTGTSQSVCCVID